MWGGNWGRSGAGVVLRQAARAVGQLPCCAACPAPSLQERAGLAFPAAAGRPRSPRPRLARLQLPAAPAAPHAAQELGGNDLQELAVSLLQSSLRTKPRKPLNPTITALF